MATIIIDLDEEDERNVGNEQQFYAKRERNLNVIGPWQPCQKVGDNNNNDDDKCCIRFVADGTTRTVSVHEIANGCTSDPIELKKIGTRVIATRLQRYLPQKMTDRNRLEPLMYTQPTEFYPGIVARVYPDDYCIFFDDGIVQFVARDNIRKVEGDAEPRHAHPNARNYFQFYSSCFQCEFKPTDKNLMVELNGDLKKATILKTDRILAKIHFTDDNRYEWIYLGSPRISTVYRYLIRQKILTSEYLHISRFYYKLCKTSDMVMIESKRPEVTLSDDDEDDDEQEVTSSTIDGAPKDYKTHRCCKACVHREDNVKLDNVCAFRRPLLTGWSHHSNFYRSPCGLNLNSYDKIYEYLMHTGSKLRINCFDFHSTMDFSTYRSQPAVVPDISYGVERIPIPVCDKVPLMDEQFNYVTNYRFDYVDVEPKSDLRCTGCNCTDNCRDKEKCSCWRLTAQRLLKRPPTKYDRKIGYNYMRLNDIVQSGIVECGRNCQCQINKCVNRVVQQELQLELEVFQADQRGWGVRTKTDVPPNTFVCSYAGDIYEDSPDTTRVTTYQFKLPDIESDDSSDAKTSDDDDDDDVESTPKKRFCPTNDVMQMMLNYFPMVKTDMAASDMDGPGDAVSYIIDAMHFGNISRFFNHSCEPNMLVQTVYTENDLRFPRYGFFTNRAIKAGQELTFDYRYDLIDEHECKCLCRSRSCRKRLY